MDIACTGPAYANAVSVDKNSGAVAIKSSLDPTSPDCFTFGESLSDVIEVNLVGKFDGNARRSESGAAKVTVYGVNYKMNFQCDFFFTEIFSGTVSTLPSVSLAGGQARSCSNTNRQRTQ